MDKELQRKLKDFFPPEDHKERPLPGGGRWFFIPWQKIRDRIDEIYPEWECYYTDPVVAADFTVIRCRLKIGGILREGVGNSAAYPDKKAYGSPIELARADAFKEAAEMFGLAAYLDDQQATARYLHSRGDYRGTKFAQENEWKAAGAMGRKTPPKAPKKNNGEISPEEWRKKFG